MIINCRRSYLGLVKTCLKSGLIFRVIAEFHYTSSVLGHFYKGHNFRVFLFFFLYPEPLLNVFYLKSIYNFLFGNKLFPCRWAKQTPVDKRDKNIVDGVAFQVRVIIPLMWLVTLACWTSTDSTRLKPWWWAPGLHVEIIICNHKDRYLDTNVHVCHTLSDASRIMLMHSMNKFATCLNRRPLKVDPSFIEEK